MLCNNLLCKLLSNKLVIGLSFIVSFQVHFLFITSRLHRKESSLVHFKSQNNIENHILSKTILDLINVKHPTSNTIYIYWINFEEKNSKNLSYQFFKIFYPL